MSDKIPRFVREPVPKPWAFGDGSRPKRPERRNVTAVE